MSAQKATKAIQNVCPKQGKKREENKILIQKNAIYWLI